MHRISPRRSSSLAALALLLAAAPAAAWHISGQVFCDANGNQAIDGLDTPLNGAGVLITSLSPPGTTFPITTGGGNGFYTKSLPDHDDDYKVELTGTGIPSGASTIVPSSGAYGVASIAAIHLQSNAFDANNVDFLVSSCVAQTPTPASSTATPTEIATPTATGTATPTPTPVPSETPRPTETAVPTITATVTRTVTPTPSASPGPLAGYQCYEVDGSTVGAILGLNVVDRFGTGAIDLDAGKRVKRICNPASVNAQSPFPPGDPDHLVGYVISGRTPRFDPVAAQTVVTQFGTVVVNVVRPILLLVPSAKSLVGPPQPLTPQIDHYQCYKVKGGRTRVAGVHVVDQFGTTTLAVKRPARLCTAVDKRGEGILDPAANLMCYTVRAAKGPTRFRGPSGNVFVANQFGPDTLAVSHGRELCLPSLVNPD